MILSFTMAMALMGIIPIHGERSYLRGPSQELSRNSVQNMHRSLQEKWTAAQQRLYERDKRRKVTNPYRTQAEEDAERKRMHEQGLIDPRRDPYNRMFGDHEYAYFREMRFQEDCRKLGINCNVHALDWDPVDRSYDYDRIHDEHYIGTPADPFPHDTTHKTVDYYPVIEYGPYPYLYPNNNDVIYWDRNIRLGLIDPSEIYRYYPNDYDDPYRDPNIRLGLVDPTPNNDYRDSRYAQKHAQEHIQNCRRYGIDCDKFTLMQMNEVEPGVRCSGSGCSVDNNIFKVVDIAPNDVDYTTEEDLDVSNSKKTQNEVQQHQRDCRLFGENCNVSDLENDNIGYDDEHDSPFPYDHEVYDYVRDEEDN